MRCVWGALFLINLAPLQAGAQSASDEVKRARELFEVGRQAYARGKYQVAAHAFEEADRLAPRPALIFSIAQSYRLQYTVDSNPKNLERAVAAYRSYLVRDPDGRRRADAAEHLAELERRRLALGISGPLEVGRRERTELVVSAPIEDAQVSVDGGPFEPLPLSRAVEPGTHRIRVEADGFVPFETELVVVKGRLTPLVARPEPLPAVLTVVGPDGADVYVDGRPVGRLPLAGPLRLEPGERSLILAKGGFRAIQKNVQLGRNERREIELELEATDRRKVSIGLLIASGVTAAATAGLFASALIVESEADELLETRETRPLSGAELGTYQDRRQTRNELYVGAFLAGAVTVGLFGAGSIMFLTDGPVLPEATVAPVVTDKGGVGAVVVGRF